MSQFCQCTCSERANSRVQTKELQTMDLKHMRFFRAEGYINFTVFCDVPCRVRYLESIPVPMSASPVEVYAIEPGTNTQWIAVQQFWVHSHFFDIKRYRVGIRGSLQRKNRGCH